VVCSNTFWFAILTLLSGIYLPFALETCFSLLFLLKACIFRNFGFVLLFFCSCDSYIYGQHLFNGFVLVLWCHRKMWLFVVLSCVAGKSRLMRQNGSNQFNRCRFLVWIFLFLPKLFAHAKNSGIWKIVFGTLITGKWWAFHHESRHVFRHLFALVVVKLNWTKGFDFSIHISFYPFVEREKIVAVVAFCFCLKKKSVQTVVSSSHVAVLCQTCPHLCTWKLDTTVLSL